MTIRSFAAALPFLVFCLFINAPGASAQVTREVTRNGNVIRQVFTAERNRAEGDMAGRIASTLNNDGREAMAPVNRASRSRTWETPWMQRRKQQKQDSYNRNDGTADEAAPAHRTINRRRVPFAADAAGYN